MVSEGWSVNKGSLHSTAELFEFSSFFFKLKKVYPFGMTEAFLSVLSYDWCAPLSHPSSCMLVNHGSLQQSCKEEYKPWKEGATARYYTSHTTTMMPTRKSVPRSSKQSGPHKDLRCKLKWHEHVFRSSGLTKTNLQGTVKRRGRIGGKTTTWTGLEILQVSESCGEQTKNEGNWLWSPLLCPNDPGAKGYVKVKVKNHFVSFW